MRFEKNIILIKEMRKNGDFTPLSKSLEPYKIC